MEMKKRTIASIAAAVIVLIIIGALLAVNYINYSQCKQESPDKPGCFLVDEENKTRTSILPKIRLDFGNKQIDLGW